jgi:hypothetical protein
VIRAPTSLRSTCWRAGTRLSGDYEQAEALYLESLDLNRGLGDGYMRSVELHNLGHVSLHRGDLDAAQRYFAECSAERKVSTQRNPYDTAMEALNDAALAHHRGNRARAASLLAEVERTLDDAGISLDPDDRFEVDWLRDRLAER